MHKKIAGEPMEELYSQLAALSGSCCSVPVPEGITDTTAT